ncbi:MAG: ribosome small subunit-dependent GTPase A [Candidatus Woesebacteria bacterium]|nr:ribosome small subunit-dependent GTPase A [Candidatus Woesebacteria bacterium]
MNNKEKVKNEDLGYNSFFEENRVRLGLSDFSVARVISEHRGGYKVKNTNGEYFAKVRGEQIFEASSREDYPAVGDWIAITEIDSEHAVIQSVLPRLTIIKRKYGDENRIGEKDKTQVIAANIDIVFVVESVDRDYNLNRFERYFAIAENGGVKPTIILNKIDLLSEEELNEKLTQLRNRFPDIDIISTSTINNKGLEDLKKYITKGKTYCFLGSSGVGKSSLINQLLGENIIRTGSIGSYSDRGKHVTTVRQMYLLENGGIVIDNPGMREISITNASQGIAILFEEIADLARKCKYTNCKHIQESNCEVINAVNLGKLDKEKYSNYINLKKEAEHYKLNNIERRGKNRQFGKSIKSAKKDLKYFSSKHK